MITLSIKGADELSRKFADLPKQVAFASSKAINDTALDVQRFEVETQLPSKLTIRSRGTPWTKPGTKFGINIRPFATKQRLVAIVGSQADWLRLQESGGTKHAAGHRIAVPSKFWKPEKRSIMTKARKPRALLGGNRKSKGLGRPFIYAGSKMPAGIYARENRRSGRLRMLFRLVGSAHVKPVLGFFASGQEVVNQTYQKHFERRLGEALATAKLA